MTAVGPTGVLLVDKPTGLSSHAAVAAVRRALHTRKVGHAGTLDPAASGLLVVGVGAGTRLLTFLVGQPKTYEATVRFGVTTDTEDAAGKVVAGAGVGAGFDVAAVTAVLPRFRGSIRQRPSSVSAIKVGGRRAYDRVRAGESVTLAERAVTIDDITVTGSGAAWHGEVPVLDVSIHTTVSSGTYIRALARDLGEAVGTGAHLTSLRRTAVGPFSVADALALAELPPAAPLLSLALVAQRVLPSVRLPRDAASAVRLGQRITTPDEPPPAAGPVALLGPAGDLLAIADVDDGRWRYRMVVPAPSPPGC